MIPLRDNIRSHRTPFVNYALIGACTVVFFLQVTTDESAENDLVFRYGMIPVRVLDPDRPIVLQEVRQTIRGPQVIARELPRPPVSAWLTLLTCMFLHGGWLHFLGNIWFLYIFGDNVEDRYGHVGYLLFYAATGVAASVAHLATNSDSVVPTIGASGAIAGVMGAYLLLYPRAMVLTLIPIFFFVQIVVLPAFLFLGIWFALQFFQGTLAIGTAQGGGVAWWAHIGGFVAGAIVVMATGRGKRRREIELIPGTQHISRYRRYGRRPR